MLLRRELRAPRIAVLADEMSLRDFSISTTREGALVRATSQKVGPSPSSRLGQIHVRQVSPGQSVPLLRRCRAERGLPASRQS